MIDIISNQQLVKIVGQDILSRGRGRASTTLLEEQERIRMLYMQKYFVHSFTSRSLLFDLPDLLIPGRDFRYGIDDLSFYSEQIARAARIVRFHMYRLLDTFSIFEFIEKEKFDSYLTSRDAAYTYMPFPDYLFLALKKDQYRPIDKKEIYIPHKEKRGEQGSRILQRESMNIMTKGEILPSLHGPGFFPYISHDLRTRENFLKARDIVFDTCQKAGWPPLNTIFDIMIKRGLVGRKDASLVAVGLPLVRKGSELQTTTQQLNVFHQQLKPKLLETYGDVPIIMIPFTMCGGISAAYHRYHWSKTEAIIGRVLEDLHLIQA